MPRVSRLELTYLSNWMSRDIVFQVIEETLFSQPTPVWRHVLITVVIVGGSVAATLLTPCLSILLELNVSSK